MIQTFRWLVVYVFAVLVASVGSFLVFALGLILHESISNALGILAVALLAAIAASWMSNILFPGGRYTQLLRVVGLSEGAAVVLIPAIVVLEPQPLVRSLLYISLALLLALIAIFAASRFRSPKRRFLSDGWVSFGLIILAIVMIYATIFVADMLGLAGA